MTRIVQNYKQCPLEYEAIVKALSDYFQNFKDTSDSVEMIWVQLLKFFKIPIPHTHTIFLQQHYTFYIDKVLNNRAISLIIDEAEKWRKLKQISEKLTGLLDDIQNIRVQYKNYDALSMSYDQFSKRYPTNNNKMNEVALIKV